MSGTCDEASHQSDLEAPSNSADAELSSANLEWLEESYPPQYVFANPDAKLPSYLGSVLQPETSSEGANIALRSYVIIPHDIRTLVVVSPSDALGPLSTSKQRSSKALFALRIHGGSLFLYRRTMDCRNSNEDDPSKHILSEPVMEASLDKLFKKHRTSLEDWREIPKNNKGKYRLRTRKGLHTYKTCGNEKGWQLDSNNCLCLIDLESSRPRKLATFKPVSAAPSGCSGDLSIILSSVFNPEFCSILASDNEFFGLTGRLDVHEESLSKGVDEELLILTCAATYLLTQQSQSNTCH
ncbi:hypothetical protein PSHT_05532 [Puccinia striiformis]|uniref:CNH domain-containing protein n=2 Tax=Puccinia striiformis TaxID=27350 RepID=A0A2S4VKI6_9BASI|nr:hypothetical protein Pst134EB_016683 [Puccinia striiformis f. sp. tritici]KAI9610205.1 hypothetical protein KEM48_002636 [Puccinia striiformis f. sp. tritici PST-130]POW10015.1 hypothetical protein PSTT_06422 [Puccinia striiformis]POW18715.1 hypothetical protein PSHT_05532 [Puccinia striiformis]